ncbi:MAG: hypothetical protein ABII74_07925 [Elusimicrobiota bacterium]
MFRFFVIALGGAIGTVCRYLVGGLDYRLSNGIFPVQAGVGTKLLTKIFEYRTRAGNGVRSCNVTFERLSG